MIASFSLWKQAIEEIENAAVFIGVDCGEHRHLKLSHGLLELFEIAGARHRPILFNQTTMLNFQAGNFYGVSFLFTFLQNRTGDCAPNCNISYL